MFGQKYGLDEAKELDGSWRGEPFNPILSHHVLWKSYCGAIYLVSCLRYASLFDLMVAQTKASPEIEQQF